MEAKKARCVGCGSSFVFPSGGSLVCHTCGRVEPHAGRDKARGEGLNVSGGFPR